MLGLSGVVTAGLTGAVLGGALGLCGLFFAMSAEEDEFCCRTRVAWVGVVVSVLAVVVAAGRVVLGMVGVELPEFGR